MFGAINKSLSGLDASATRGEASASNVVNSRNTILTEDARTEPRGRAVIATRQRYTNRYGCISHRMAAGGHGPNLCLSNHRT